MSVKPKDSSELKSEKNTKTQSVQVKEQKKDEEQIESTNSQLV